jgi:hypothetical protein
MILLLLLLLAHGRGFAGDCSRSLHGCGWLLRACKHWPLHVVLLQGLLLPNLQLHHLHILHVGHLLHLLHLLHHLHLLQLS